MCEIVEKIIKEARLDLARDAIADGDLSTEQIARIFKLQLSEVQKLAEEMSGQPDSERE